MQPDHASPAHNGAPPANPETSPLPTGRQNRPVILVVDDVEGNRELVCRRLASHAYDLHAVDSGQAALAFIRARRPDLVLLDYMMPNMNGIEVLRILRQDWQMNAMPVIMLTARAESEAVVAALEAGADDYITKPIDFDVLCARVETQLTKMRSSVQLRAANAALDERATMRVLAFDELRDELEREIAQRRRAEKALDKVHIQLGKCLACGGIGNDNPRMPTIGGEAITAMAAPAPTPPGAAPAASAEHFARALEIIDVITRALDTGKPVNPALLAALRLQITTLAAALSG